MKRIKMIVLLCAALCTLTACGAQQEQTVAGTCTLSISCRTLADAPETLNSDPYGAWIIKVEGIGGTEELLDAAAYEAHCAEEG